MAALPLIASEYRTRSWTTTVSFIAFKVDCEARQNYAQALCPGADPRDVYWYEPNSYALSGNISLAHGWTLTWSVSIDLDDEGNVWSDPDEAEYPPDSGCWDYIGPFENDYRPLEYTGYVVVYYELRNPNAELIEDWTERSSFLYDAYVTPSVQSVPVWGTPGNIGFLENLQVQKTVTLTISAPFDLEGDQSLTDVLELQERCPADREWSVSCKNYTGSEAADTVCEISSFAPQNQRIEIYSRLHCPVGQWLDAQNQVLYATLGRSATVNPPATIDYTETTYTFDEIEVVVSGNALTIDTIAEPSGTDYEIRFTDRYSPVSTTYSGAIKRIDGSSCGFTPSFLARQLRSPVWVDASPPNYGSWFYLENDPDPEVEWESWQGTLNRSHDGGWRLEVEKNSTGIIDTSHPYATELGVAEYEGAPSGIGHIYYDPPATEDENDNAIPLVSSSITPLRRENALTVTVGTLSTPAVFEETSGWVNTNCDINANGDRLRIYNVGVNAEVSRDFTSGKVRVGGARFAVVDVKSDTAGARCVLEIAEHAFEIIARKADTRHDIHIDLCRPGCTLNGNYNSGPLQFYSGTDSLLHASASGRLMYECCCDWDCPADEQQNSLIDVELPWGGSMDHVWKMRPGFGPSRLTQIRIIAIDSGTEWEFWGLRLYIKYAPRIWVVPTGPNPETDRTIALDDNGESTEYAARPVTITVDGKIVLEGVDRLNMHESPGSDGACGPWFPLDDYETPAAVQSNGLITISAGSPTADTFFDLYNSADTLEHNWGGLAHGTHAANVRFYSVNMPNGFGSVTWTIDKYIRSASWGLAFRGAKPAGGSVSLEDSNNSITNPVLNDVGAFVSGGLRAPTVIIDSGTVTDTTLSDREIRRSMVSK